MWKIALEIKKASFVNKWEFGRWDCLEYTELSCLGVLGAGNVVIVCLFFSFCASPLPPKNDRKQG